MQQSHISVHFLDCQNGYSAILRIYGLTHTPVVPLQRLVPLCSYALRGARTMRPSCTRGSHHKVCRRSRRIVYLLQESSCHIRSSQQVPGREILANTRATPLKLPLCIIVQGASTWITIKTSRRMARECERTCRGPAICQPYSFHYSVYLK